MRKAKPKKAVPKRNRIRAPKKPVADPNRLLADAVTPFASWLAAMGYNRKQVAEAGARVGLSPQAAGHRNRGETDMGQLELLGLTAAYFGLPPWQPDLADKLDERARTMMKLAREDIERCLAD